MSRLAIRDLERIDEGEIKARAYSLCELRIYLDCINSAGTVVRDPCHRPFLSIQFSSYARLCILDNSQFVWERKVKNALQSPSRPHDPIPLPLQTTVK